MHFRFLLQHIPRKPKNVIALLGRDTSIPLGGRQISLSRNPSDGLIGSPDGTGAVGVGLGPLEGMESRGAGKGRVQR